MPPSPPAPPRPDLGYGPPPAAAEPAVQPDVTWQWWHALALFFLGFFVLGSALAFVVAMAFGRTVDRGSGIGLPGVVVSGVADLAFGAVMVAWLRRRTPAWTEAIRLPEARRRLGDFARGLGIGVVLYPAVALGVGIVLQIVFRVLLGREVSPPDQLSPDLSTIGRVVAAVFAVGVAPVVEELFWRGIMFRSLRRYGFWVAALVSSALFGLVHYYGGPAPGAVLLMLSAAFTGLGLSVVYERFGLATSIGAHVAFNAIGIAFIFTIG